MNFKEYVETYLKSLYPTEGKKQKYATLGELSDEESGTTAELKEGDEIAGSVTLAKDNSEVRITYNHKCEKIRLLITPEKVRYEFQPPDQLRKTDESTHPTKDDYQPQQALVVEQAGNYSTPIAQVRKAFNQRKMNLPAELYLPVLVSGTA